MAYRGSCPEMCPGSERKARFGLYMSIFEKDQNNQPDERLMVKEYRRSGADQEEPAAEDLRTPRALELTMHYLVCNILDDSRSKTQELALEWYDFLWDRLRAIRKDITQQNICDQASAILVERCARFHVHSCYAMTRVKNFDVDMNKRNLNDCLQMLRQMYHDLKTMGLQCPGQLEFQKYDILLHLNEDHLSSIVLMKTSDYRETAEMKFVIRVFNAYTNNQYYRFFQLMGTADYMTSCILSLYSNKMRLLGLRAIINACAPRLSTLYPAQSLIDSLGFDDIDDLKSFSSALDIELQQKEDGQCFLVLNRETIQVLRRAELLIGPFKSKRLIEDKIQDRPVGQLMNGTEELPSESECFMMAHQETIDEHDMIEGTIIEPCISAGKRSCPEDDGEEVTMHEEEPVEDHQLKRQKHDDIVLRPMAVDGGQIADLIDEHDMIEGTIIETSPRLSAGKRSCPEDDGEEVTMHEEEPVEDHQLKRQKHDDIVLRPMAVDGGQISWFNQKFADLMPSGCYKVRSLSARLPTLNLPSADANQSLTPRRKPANCPQKSIDSITVGIEDEAKANQVFSLFIQEFDNSIGT